MSILLNQILNLKNRQFRKDWNLLSNLSIHWNNMLTNDDSLLVLLSHFVLLKPKMIFDIFKPKPFLRISVKYTRKDIFSQWTEEFRSNVLSWYDFGIQLLNLWSIERKMTRKHGVKNDSRWPNVNLVCSVFFS